MKRIFLILSVITTYFFVIPQIAKAAYTPYPPLIIENHEKCVSPCNKVLCSCTSQTCPDETIYGECGTTKDGSCKCFCEDFGDTNVCEIVKKCSACASACITGSTNVSSCKSCCTTTCSTHNSMNPQFSCSEYCKKTCTLHTF